MDKDKLNKLIELDKIISQNKESLSLIEYWEKEGNTVEKILISFGGGIVPVKFNLNVKDISNYIKLITKDELNKMQKELESI